MNKPIKELDFEIEKYNKKFNFFRKKHPILKSQGSFFAGVDYHTNKPIILLQDELRFNVLLLGEKEIIRRQYKKIIFQKIENNEPFIFINNIITNPLLFIDKLKKHMSIHVYSYPLILDNYSELSNIDFSDKKNSYIFNIADITVNKAYDLQDQALLLYDQTLEEYLYDLLFTKLQNTLPSFKDDLITKVPTTNIIIGYIHDAKKFHNKLLHYLTTFKKTASLITAYDITDNTNKEHYSSIFANCYIKILLNDTKTNTHINIFKDLKSNFEEIKPQKSYILRNNILHQIK